MDYHVIIILCYIYYYIIMFYCNVIILLMYQCSLKVTSYMLLKFKVGPSSSATSLHCLCNHLTSFGGGVLVMPNTLDFDVVFTELARLHDTGNFAVLSAIITALLLYILVVIFARRADNRDKAKVRLVIYLLRQFLFAVQLDNYIRKRDHFA